MTHPGIGALVRIKANRDLKELEGMAAVVIDTSGPMRIIRLLEPDPVLTPGDPLDPDIRIYPTECIAIDGADLTPTERAEHMKFLLTR